MDVIYALIPGMIFIGLVMVGVLIWAVKSGQYDDLEGDAQRLLMEEDGTSTPRRKRRRKTAAGNTEKRPGPQLAGCRLKARAKTVGWARSLCPPCFGIKQSVGTKKRAHPTNIEWTLCIRF